VLPQISGAIAVVKMAAVRLGMMLLLEGLNYLT
jgi:hypothetical protein